MDAKGKGRSEDVVAPTAMNYTNIEADVAAFLPHLQELPQDEVDLKLTMLIRAYDPCISCSVHVIQTES